MNAQLAFENFRHLRMKFLCHEVFGKSEVIKGKSGQIGSVSFVESLDKKRAYELRLVSLNEQKLEVVFETLDYKEPFDPKHVHIEGEHQHHEGDHHDHFKLAKRRITKMRVYNITNPLFGEDLVNLQKKEGGDEIIGERCMVKWSTKLSMDGSPSQLHYLELYKKQVIRHI
jgi:hypothetical protein